MKKKLIVIFLLGMFCAEAQSINQTDSKGRKHGLWKKEHENGEPRYIGTFEHGKETGTFKFYFDNGNIKAINKFRGKTGVAYSYQFGGDSILAAEGKYVNKLRDSIWTFYDIDGNIVAREEYKDNIKDGKSLTFYPSGQKAEILNYENGKKEGKWIQYYESGKLKAKGQYLDDHLSGEVIYYGAEGKPSAKGEYVRGLMHGNWYFFDDKMDVERTQVWKYGTLMSSDPEMEKEDFELTETE